MGWGPGTRHGGYHTGAVVKRSMPFRTGDTRFTSGLSKSFGGCSNRKGIARPGDGRPGCRMPIMCAVMQPHDRRAAPNQIYLDGVSGRRPPIPLDADRLEDAARRRMRPEAFAYVAAGAGNERTVAANRAAFDRWRIVPRMLRDVEQARHQRRAVRATTCRARSCSRRSACSSWPTRGGLRGGARGARHRHRDGVLQPGLPADGGRVPDPRRHAALVPALLEPLRRLVESLAARAERCGCRAIVITLDTTMLGWRSRDLEGAYLPFLHGKGIAQYTSDPVFRRLAHRGVARGRRPASAATQPGRAAHPDRADAAPIRTASGARCVSGRGRPPSSGSPRSTRARH